MAEVASAAWRRQAPPLLYTKCSASHIVVAALALATSAMVDDWSVRQTIPAWIQLMLNTKQVQRLTKRVVDKIEHGFRLLIKAWHRWKNDASCLGNAGH